ncbi:tyrosine-type recombinase/integrase [Azonexus hydrophilus]
MWRISEGRMKMRREHAVPLPRQAAEMLRVLHGVTGRHALLFPNRDDRTKAMATASFRQCPAGLGGKFSPHATRTTGSY